MATPSPKNVSTSLATNDPAQIESTKERPLAVMLNNPAVVKRFEQAAGIRAGSFIVNIVNAANSNPAIWECEPASVITAGLNAAALDLSLAPALGQGCILPYNKNKKVGDQWVKTKHAAFVPMVRGIKQLALRTNQYRFLNAFKIYEGMSVKEDVINGVWTLEGFKTSDRVTHYGASFELVNGYRHAIVWSVEDVESHAKSYSPTFDKKNGEFYKDSRWVTHFDEMALKTVMKHLILHYGIISERDRANLETAEAEAEGEIINAPFSDLPDESEPQQAPIRTPDQVQARAAQLFS